MSIVLGCAVLAALGLFRAPTDCRLPGMWRARPDEHGLTRRRLVDAVTRIDRIAARYREFVRTLPRESDSLAAREGFATRPDRAFQYCEAVLRRELARTYGIAVSELPRSSDEKSSSQKAD